jgi:hypothetical protein
VFLKHCNPFQDERRGKCKSLNFDGRIIIECKIIITIFLKINEVLKMQKRDGD